MKLSLFLFLLNCDVALSERLRGSYKNRNANPSIKLDDEDLYTITVPEVSLQDEKLQNDGLYTIIKPETQDSLASNFTIVSNFTSNFDHDTIDLPPIPGQTEEVERDENGVSQGGNDGNIDTFMMEGAELVISEIARGEVIYDAKEDYEESKQQYMDIALDVYTNKKEANTLTNRKHSSRSSSKSSSSSSSTKTSRSSKSSKSGKSGKSKSKSRSSSTSRSTKSRKSDKSSSSSSSSSSSKSSHTRSSSSSSKTESSKSKTTNTRSSSNSKKSSQSDSGSNSSNSDSGSYDSSTDFTHSSESSGSGDSTDDNNFIGGPSTGGGLNPPSQPIFGTTFIPTFSNNGTPTPPVTITSVPSESPTLKPTEAPVPAPIPPTPVQPTPTPPTPVPPTPTPPTPPVPPTPTPPTTPITSPPTLKPTEAPVPAPIPPTPVQPTPTPPTPVPPTPPTTNPPTLNPDEGGCPPLIMLNELSYQNRGPDLADAIEVVYTTGFDITGYSVHFYQGSNRGVYNSISLADTQGISTDREDGFAYHSYTLRNAINEDGPNGLALVDPSGNVLEFWCYQGTFEAASGPAAGQTCLNMGVTLPANNFGQSLQRIGTGYRIEDFPSWTGPITVTLQGPSAGQTIACPTRRAQSYAMPGVHRK